MFWERLKSIGKWFGSVVLSLFPVLTTYFAFETVRTIYRSEQYRHQSERLRLTYEALHRYVVYQQSSPSFAPCSEALVQMSAEEIRALLQYPTRPITVKYDPMAHGPLARCLATDQIGPPGDGELWTIPVENTLRKRNLHELDHFDALLIVYRNEELSRPVICENVRGLMIIRNKDDRPLRFLTKLRELELLQEFNYPNLVAFLDEFATRRECPRRPSPQSADRGLLEMLGLLKS